MKRHSCRVLLGAALILLCSPEAGLAALFEWGTEGSYVHQTAHLLFLGAMLFFIRQMYKSGFQEHRGFRRLIWACWLLALWNLDAIIGHTIDWSLHHHVFVGEGLSRRLLMENVRTWLFYFTQLNHFLLLPPAFYLFYRGLRLLEKEYQAKRP
jgi:hypothetical protein